MGLSNNGEAFLYIGLPFMCRGVSCSNGVITAVSWIAKARKIYVG